MKVLVLSLILFIYSISTFTYLGVQPVRSQVNPLKLASMSPSVTIGQTKQSDGKPISLVKIDIPQKYDEIESYKLTYWSGGVRAVAYVAAPKEQGVYPLYVTLHGGYSLPTHLTHVTTVNDDGKTITTASPTQIQDSGLRMILLAPMYRGYGQSEGTVQGLKGDTLDTENAITALDTYLKALRGGPKIREGHISLSGVSMGGGVALKVASERDDIENVIATSPFVGWDIVGAWDQQHDKDDYLEMQSDFGPFDPTNSAYQAQSINYRAIIAPVLLIQGTNDSKNPYQTVQVFYEKMKLNHHQVMLKLIKGGNHGLSNKADQVMLAFNEFSGDYLSD